MPRKLVLVLEDDTNRIEKFKNLLSNPNLEVHYVQTAKDAIERCAVYNYDLLFLDHDLGGEQMLPSGPGTGYEVAQWLEAHPDRCVGTIILHSYNPGGRENMARCLPEAIQMPGVWLSETLL